MSLASEVATGWPVHAQCLALARDARVRRAFATRTFRAARRVSKARAIRGFEQAPLARVTQRARGASLGALSRRALRESLMFARSLVSPARAALLEERARTMRLTPTRSEEWLWRRLSGSKTGFAFRRQLVIGEFIVDFACTKVRLVVESDGGYHEGRQRKDAARDRDLHELGWSVFRVADHEVLADLDAVVIRIAERARLAAAARQP